jgi:hypothetical protein
MRKPFLLACLCAVAVLSQPTPDKWKLGAGIVIYALLSDDACINDFLKGTGPPPLYLPLALLSGANLHPHQCSIRTSGNIECCSTT